MTAAQLTFAAAILLLSGASAQLSPASAPGEVVMGPSSPGAMAPTPDCMTNLMNMSDCLSYVMEGSKTEKPDPACCPELAGLVDSNPQCLCYLLDKNATASYGISIDLPKALKLPSVCGVQTPPVSQCSAITGVPVEGPASSPAITGVPVEGPASSTAITGGPVEGPASSPGVTPNGAAASPTNGNRDGGATGIEIAKALASIVALAISFLPIVFF